MNKQVAPNCSDNVGLFVQYSIPLHEFALRANLIIYTFATNK